MRSTERKAALTRNQTLERLVVDMARALKTGMRRLSLHGHGETQDYGDMRAVLKRAETYIREKPERYEEEEDDGGGLH